MKNTLLLFIIIAFGFNKNQEETILVDLYGDLTNDKVDERVVVTELAKEGEYGKIRLLQIFTKKNNKWIELANSKSAILESESGGFSGDPFISKSLKITNGILEISHDGGSSWKWFITHKFRYQNNKFELIGYNYLYGKPCEYFETTDFNLFTGIIHFEKEFETCENKEQITTKEEKEEFVKKIRPLPNLKTINREKIKIVTPKFKNEIYL